MQKGCHPNRTDRTFEMGTPAATEDLPKVVPKPEPSPIPRTVAGHVLSYSLNQNELPAIVGY